MREAARLLDFERAAELRDEIKELKERGIGLQASHPPQRP